MARLYVDEDLANFVVPLREAGHDVLSARESGAERSDPWHLRQASVDGRTLATFNERDFRYLHRLWTSLRAFHVMDVQHSGIVTATAQLEPPAWLPALNELFGADEDMTGRMLTWHPGRHEWREDRWRPEV